MRYIQDDSTRADARPMDAGTVRALTIDLFGRPPLEDERTHWIGRPRAEFIARALASDEAWRHWLDEQLYYFMLIDRFRPVGTSLDELPELLAKRAMPPRDALHRIALSTSFDLRNPGADTFVTVVMEQFCGIQVQRAARELELGKRAYDGDRVTFLGEEAATQSDVVRIAARHDQAAEHFVAREHERLTGTTLERGDAKRAARVLAKDPRAAYRLYTDWLLSSVYDARLEAGRPVSNHTWVRMVHLDLGRPAPSSAEVEALRSALDGLGDPAPLRSAIVRMALEVDGLTLDDPRTADEARAFVVRTFERLLGRRPTPEEASAFAEAALDEMGVRTVLYVLMTSEEYERP